MPITGRRLENTPVTLTIIKITTTGCMEREMEHQATPDKLIKEQNHQRESTHCEQRGLRSGFLSS